MEEDFLDSESAFKFEMDVEGLMRVVRSTEDSVVTEVGDRLSTMVFLWREKMVMVSEARIVFYVQLLSVVVCQCCDDVIPSKHPTCRIVN